jgi:hypothetical protein
VTVEIEPASIDQVRIGFDGRVVVIDAEMSQIVADLQAIIPEIRVRFAEEAKEPFWAVSLISDDGLSHHLVCTAKATMTSSGTWAGLDERLVQRIAELDSHGRGHYDYAKEVERQNLEAKKRQRREFRERMDEIGEHAQRELRDAGVGRSQSRAFIPRQVR